MSLLTSDPLASRYSSESLHSFGSLDESLSLGSFASGSSSVSDGVIGSDDVC